MRCIGTACIEGPPHSAHQTGRDKGLRDRCHHATCAAAGASSQGSHTRHVSRTFRPLPCSQEYPRCSRALFTTQSVGSEDHYWSVELAREGFETYYEYATNQLGCTLSSAVYSTPAHGVTCQTYSPCSSIWQTPPTRPNSVSTPDCLTSTPRHRTRRSLGSATPLANHAGPPFGRFGVSQNYPHHPASISTAKWNWSSASALALLVLAVVGCIAFSISCRGRKRTRCSHSKVPRWPGDGGGKYCTV